MPTTTEIEDGSEIPDNADLNSDFTKITVPQLKEHLKNETLEGVQQLIVLLKKLI